MIQTREMNWAAYAVTLVILIMAFLLTGYFVSPTLASSPGNEYNAQSSGYYIALMLHYVFGGLFVAFAVIGGLRDAAFTSDARQAAFVWAWSLLASAWWTAAAVHTMMPTPSSRDPLI